MPAEVLMQQDERQRFMSQYAEIAALAGGLAHEIKNPLSTISLNLELLVEDLEEGTAAKQQQRDRRMLTKLKTVQRECQHLEAILEDFLKFVRVGELELIETDLNQLVREFIDFYQPEAAVHGLEISPHLGADLPLVRLDPVMIRQILMNLALNAQQAMPKGGLLELQTSCRDEHVHLDLIDNGVGMDNVTLSRIYDAFFSTKAGGSGLGLPAVKRIVQAHGGQISVESAPGRGTRFTISFPAPS